jgi:hypothetical protein
MAPDSPWASDGKRFGQSSNHIRTRYCVTLVLVFTKWLVLPGGVIPHQLGAPFVSVRQPPQVSWTVPIAGLGRALVLRVRQEEAGHEGGLPVANCKGVALP